MENYLFIILNMLSLNGSGGGIRAESEEGRGSVFYLELPAAGGNK